MHRYYVIIFNPAAQPAPARGDARRRNPAVGTFAAVVGFQAAPDLRSPSCDDRINVPGKISTDRRRPPRLAAIQGCTAAAVAKTIPLLRKKLMQTDLRPCLDALARIGGRCDAVEEWLWV